MSGKKNKVADEDDNFKMNADKNRWGKDAGDRSAYGSRSEAAKDKMARAKAARKAQRAAAGGGGGGCTVQ